MDLTLSVSSVLACSVLPVPAVSTGTVDGDMVVARWNGGELTRAGLDEAAANELRALDIEHQLARYERTRRVAEREIDAALLDAEARRRGLPTEAVLAEVEAGAASGGERAARLRAWRAEMRRAADVVVTVPYPDLPRQEVPVTDSDPAVGPARAPLSIVAFGGYQCFYCREVNATLGRLRAQWPDEIRVVYKDFPMSSNPSAVAASVAARCAHDQGRFEPMHEALLAHQQAQSEADLLRYAVDAGLDVPAFEACRSSGRFEALVARDVAVGQQLGVASTPTLFIDGVLVAGAQPYEVLAGIVTTRLASTAP